jgi:hypothetical protein
VQLDPAPRLAPHAVAKLNAFPPPEPVSDIAEMVSAAVPLLVNVTVWLELLPTAAVPKERLEALSTAFGALPATPVPDSPTVCVPVAFSEFVLNDKLLVTAPAAAGTKSITTEQLPPEARTVVAVQSFEPAIR